MPNSTQYCGTFFGSQIYPERARVVEAMEHAHRQRPITLLVHGGGIELMTPRQVGVDDWAESWAFQRGVPVERHHPDTVLCRRPRQRAGEAMRNKMMAERGAHLCIAFPTDDWSAGNLVGNAERFRISVWRPFGRAPVVSSD